MHVGTSVRPSLLVLLRNYGNRIREITRPDYSSFYKSLGNRRTLPLTVRMPPLIFYEFRDRRSDHNNNESPVQKLRSHRFVPRPTSSERARQQSDGVRSHRMVKLQGS